MSAREKRLLYLAEKHKKKIDALAPLLVREQDEIERKLEEMREQLEQESELENIRANLTREKAALSRLDWDIHWDRRLRAVKAMQTDADHVSVIVLRDFWDKSGKRFRSGQTSVPRASLTEELFLEGVVVAP